ncbi:hypothetical protein RZV17_02190 [Xanthomonas cannabis]|uniref:hypothetical protein n=1 Tax=Xanthomonas cannabis TaxID=1885674 RepID=UPI0033B1C4A2
MLGWLIGIGPCRISCSFDRSILMLFGQEYYNAIYGFLWLFSGCILILFVFLKDKWIGGKSKGGKDRRNKRHAR